MSYSNFYKFLFPYNFAGAGHSSVQNVPNITILFINSEYQITYSFFRSSADVGNYQEMPCIEKE